MRIKKNQTLLVVILLGLFCTTTLLAVQYTCTNCNIPETIECRGTESCTGYQVIDCSGCDFVCGILVEGEWYYGPGHGCEEVPPI